MIQKTLAKRYASALLTLADQLEQVEEVRTQLLDVRDIYESEPYIQTVMRHPRIPRARKKQIVARLLEDKIGSILLEFLYLLIDKGRFIYLPDIAEAFDRLADSSKGILRANVKTFLPLSETHLDDLHKLLARVTGKEVLIEVQTDRLLRGGIQIRIGDRVIDGSIASRLRSLREHLLSPS